MSSFTRKMQLLQRRAAPRTKTDAPRRLNGRNHHGATFAVDDTAMISRDKRAARIRELAR